ncbi:glycosyltransferase family 2 protein [Telmatospirillum sp. J64-1]|uniref:glycosyltransferase n=1 Tax=Telmatospirillum sp. J64-1 TaxID=2502183 RepID=UPI00115E8816|nr:glycosyltransferase [Telmatospirillum sp. J64-1]
MPPFSVIIPTLNAESQAVQVVEALRAQDAQPTEVLVVDSNSRDRTTQIFQAFGARVLSLGTRCFDHGGTREWARSHVKTPIIIYLTQDSIPVGRDCFRKIVEALEADESIGMGYGRQIPHMQATALARHHRVYNYGETSHVRSFADLGEFGLRTCFASNSFAAYKMEALDVVGGFPTKTIFGEDMLVAARMLHQGRKVAYVADAAVYHSHDYTISEEFRRYFDNGTFHRVNPWIRELFGNATGEGWRFVRSEVLHVLREGAPWLLPSLVIRTIAKYAGFHCGLHGHRLPQAWCRRFSMNRGYWSSDEAATARPVPARTPAMEVPEFAAEKPFLKS